jgi:hypothetical protein
MGWSVHSWSTFGAKMSHGQLGHTKFTMARTWGSHHLPPYAILYNFPWGPHPNGLLSRDSHLGVLKFPQLGLPWLWRRITWHANLRLQWGLKQSCILCQELSKSYVTRCLHARKSGRFLTFSGRESNCHFDSRPFFWPKLVFQMSTWAMQAHFRHLRFNNFPMI